MNAEDGFEKFIVGSYSFNSPDIKDNDILYLNKSIFFLNCNNYLIIIIIEIINEYKYNY